MSLDTWVISSSKVVPSVIWMLRQLPSCPVNDGEAWLPLCPEGTGTDLLPLMNPGHFFFQEVLRWHQSLFHSSLSVCLFSSPKECPACCPPPVPYEADRSGLGSLVKGLLFFIVPRISPHILTSCKGGCVHFIVKQQSLFFQLRTLWVQKEIVEKGLLMYQFSVCFYIFIYSL